MDGITPTNSTPVLVNVRSLTTGGVQGTPDDQANARSLSLLTSDDWAAVSASVGHPCGPDKDGNVEALQPSIAWSIANDRQAGVLQGPLTARHLQSNLVPGQDKDYADQLTKAIAFLQGREQAVRSIWAQDPILRGFDRQA